MKRRLHNKDFGLVMFDHHFDFREPIPGKEHSGHWLKTLEDMLDYRNVAIVGIGAPVYSERYMRELENRGALIKSVYDVRKQGRAAVCQEVMEHVTLNTESVYFTVDIDGIDQAFAPGCSVPNANGLFPYEVIDTIFEMASLFPTVGIDITEVNPWFDRHEPFTAHIAAQIVINFMAGVAKAVFGV